MAINTDAQALAQLGVASRMTLGAKLTRGLGTGGDPDMGRAAAEEDAEKIRALCAGADVVCVVAGLGGGTGTGAGPVWWRGWRSESGALVLGIATLPFEFEGARRQTPGAARFARLEGRGRWGDLSAEPESVQAHR